MANNPAYKKRARGFLDRRVEKREPRPRFLIVCEGKKTEVNYFRGFRVLTAMVVELDIQGLGFNTFSLVERAIEIENEAKDKYEQAWCVFDRNSYPADLFNRAIALAAEHDIHVAYSNQSFELWYLLHFHYRDTALHRDNCLEILSQELGFKYEKNNEMMYKILKDRQPIAIRHARRLLAEYHPRNPESDNPSTTVHLLVEELNKFIQ